MDTRTRKDSSISSSKRSFDDGACASRSIKDKKPKFEAAPDYDSDRSSSISNEEKNSESASPCDCEENISKMDLKEKAEEALCEMEQDKNAMLGMGSVYDVTVTVSVECPNCEEEVEVNLEVDADVFWESEDDYTTDRPPNVDSYEVTDYRIVKRTFPGRDLMDAAMSHLLGDEYDEYVEDHRDFNIPDEALEKPTETELYIVAKTYMNAGYCLMGFDRDNTFKRPIYRTEVSSCCWPRDENFKLWHRYKFTVLRHPGAQTEAPTPLPHSTEDTVVEQNFQVIGGTAKADLFNRLLGIAKSKPEDIFPPLKFKRYVFKDANCPSVGILKCKGKNLEVKKIKAKNGAEKKRLVVTLPYRDVYDFSLTGLAYQDPDQSDDTYLVLLGLARPWNNNGDFNPERCYVLALNVFKQGH